MCSNCLTVMNHWLVYYLFILRYLNLPRGSSFLFGGQWQGCTIPSSFVNLGRCWHSFCQSISIELNESNSLIYKRKPIPKCSTINQFQWIYRPHRPKTWNMWIGNENWIHFCWMLSSREKYAIHSSILCPQVNFPRHNYNGYGDPQSDGK